MLLPARNIWDIKIQSVCCILSARDRDGVEIFLSANFGQASVSPPRVIINPSRLYPIEPVIRRERRFAINVLGASQRRTAIRLINVRRRAIHKDILLGIVTCNDSRHDIPYVSNCLRTLFCEVEEVLNTGDHTVMIARVLDSMPGRASRKERPLLFAEISGTPSRYLVLSRMLKRVLVTTRAREGLVKLLRRTATIKVDLAANTYEDGGQTDSEVNEIVRHGLHDDGRTVSPPRQAPGVLKQRLGVCVVGVGSWGFYHCQLFRKASRRVDLYVCGRDPDRVARVARGVGAKDIIIGLEKALEDPRVQAVSLVLPHDLHRKAVEMAAAAGKHALVEKPIATTLEDADAMIEAARRSGIIFMVAEDMHFRPAVREAVRAIDEGNIGEPLYLQAHAGGIMRPQGWKRDTERMGGGILMDIGVHYSRALRLLMGEPNRVFASRAMQINTKMGGEDSVQILFSSRFGWQAHMLLSWSSWRGHAPDLVIAGERGTLQLWPGDPHLDFYPVAPRPITQLLGSLRPRWLGEKLMSPVFQRVRRAVPGGHEAAYLAEAREFVSAVEKQREPLSRPLDARRDLQIVLCAYDALRRESWVDITAYTQP